MQTLLGEQAQSSPSTPRPQHNECTDQRQKVLPGRHWQKLQHHTDSATAHVDLRLIPVEVDPLLTSTNAVPITARASRFIVRSKNQRASVSLSANGARVAEVASQ